MTKQMNYKRTCKAYNTKISLSSFLAAKGGVNEYQVMIEGENPTLSYEEQLEYLLDTFAGLLKDELKGAVCIFKRYFLSDAANQAKTLMLIATEHSDCALSLVGQPPLNGTKVALWAYLLTGVETKALSSGLYEVTHGAYRHLWGGGAFNRAANSEYQTRLLLNDYVMQLMEQDCRLAFNCVRTWFFVRDVDVNYAGVVKARNEVFHTQGLTADTHYISSTGIGGCHFDANVSVMMDTYAVSGIDSAQIQFLYAPAYLNPTYEYGVSFERGTCVKYGDRRQIFISGTASIDNKGEVVAVGDICKQTLRMWDNVEALLKEVECGFDDLVQAVVYLRDPADYNIVNHLFEMKFPDLPYLLVHAPVCRPAWLIEMECIAVKADENDFFPAY